MEAARRKKYMIAAIIYASVIFLVLMISNLTAFNSVLSQILRVFRALLIGLVIAYLCNPFFRLYERNLFYKIKPHALRRAIALLFTYLTLFLIFAILLLLIIPQLTASILEFIDNSDAFIDTAITDANGIIDWINGILPTNEGERDLILPLDAAKIKKSLSSFFESVRLDSEIWMNLFNADTLGTLFQLAENIASLITDTIFGLFISIYFLHTKEKRYAQVMRLRRAIFSDAVNERITGICTVADRSFGGFLRGKLLDSTIVGVLVYIAISILGVPYAILIAAIIAITDVVPVVGPFIGVIPSAVIILLTAPAKVIPFLLCILIVQQIDGNIIAPKILGENTGVSSLCVIIAITTMGSLWGLAGMVLGVPLFATVLELTSKYLDKRLIKKGLPTDTEKYYASELGVADTETSDDTPPKAPTPIPKDLFRFQPEGGEGDLTVFEHFCLDTYDLVKKHDLFTDKSDEVLSGFAKDEAELTATAEEQFVEEKLTEQKTETADITDGAVAETAETAEAAEAADSDSTAAEAENETTDETV